MLIWIVILCSITLLVRWTGFADRAFFHPGRNTPPPPVGAEEIWFTNRDGHRLHGWLLKPAGIDRPPVVIHCHGNAGTIDDHLGFSDFLVEDGLAVFIFDYRGYGRSADHKPSRASIIEDTSAALDFVLTRSDLDLARVGLLGVSLGGVPASHVAASRAEVCALALVSPFSSWSGVARDHLPIIAGLLVQSGSDPMEAVAKLGSRPLFILHGDRDRIVRPHHGERLHQAASAAGVRATLRPVVGADHNDIMEFPEARAALVEFFATSLQNP